MIRPCNREEFPLMLGIVNDAAQAYRGVIPVDCWAEPYMPAEELRREIEERRVGKECRSRWSPYH